MNLHFPADFQFGTSTSAYQIETPFEHDWVNFKSRDNHTFDQTTHHEENWQDDVKIISSLAPNYRMSLMWSRLQRGPNESFHQQTINDYHQLLASLRAHGVNIMMVLHHFANPTWFTKAGGWEKKSNIKLFIDYGKRLVDEFGAYVTNWNTFNEPNLYTSMGWVAGEFPPQRKNIFVAKNVINNIAEAHDEMYDYIKSRFPGADVGISHNCTIFAADHWLGNIPAKVMDLCYMEYAPSLFKKIDFFGMSYYARIGHDPFPVTYITTPEKFKQNGKPHDDMWEYYPQGLLECMRRYWNEFKKPIIVTENGTCTSDDSKRVTAIRDYLTYVHQAIQDGIDVRGYYHWSSWDNFEWSLGPTYYFGLYGCDWKTKERFRKPSADVYAEIAKTKRLIC